MKRKKKKLLTIFLIFYIVIEVILILYAILYNYTCMTPSGPGGTEQIEIAKRNVALYPVIFGISAPLIFYIFWKYKYKKKKKGV